MKINRVSEVTEKAKAFNMPVLTELIMGLPGETYDTWVDSVCEVFANKIINLDIFFLQLIENAPMNVSDSEKFQLETFQAYDYFYETSSSVEEELGQGTAEIVNVIRSTSTLTPDELYACNEFSWFVVGTHCYGVTTHISDYLYDKKGITYQEFYLGLMDHVKQDLTVNQWFNDYKNAYEFWKAMGYTHSKIGGYTIQGGWKGLNSLMPVIQFNKYLNKFLDLVCDFLTRYDLSDQLISDYRKIVNLYVKQYGKYLTVPKTIKLQSDILGVSEITASDRYDQFPDTLSEHIDFMFFARRRNWYLNTFSI